ncbi:tetratricopeptide repeat-containing sensor histidine kinase [Epilithonimonas hungarica]|uniref:histidine kinase n=1 Tax=Epilithonimonas hungarica TaxID=454006 RepID=A0A1G7NQQ3_9FLAO|nr:ATP-binding protein [Epilithonimonas hungarica]SDF76306.1 Signal transduction histidine kinase [Epilithonimonas hungarica]
MSKIWIFLMLNLTLFLFSQKQPDLLQYKTTEDKIKAWDSYCNLLTETENYPLLIQEADIGIGLAKKNAKYLSKFYFYKGYGYEYTNNQYEKATVYFEKSLELAKGKYLEQEVLALMRLNYMYYSIKEYKKGEELIDYVKKIVDTIKPKNLKATLLGSIGEYYLDRSEFENFINYKLKAIDYLLLDKEKKETSNNIGISYLQIADAYNDMKQYEKAVEYTNYAVPYLKRSDGIAFLYNTYIEAYTHLGNIDLAKKYYQELYQIGYNNQMLFLNVSYANRNMSEFYLEKNRLELADDYADKALFFATKSNDEEILMEANTVKGKVLVGQGKYSEAIKTLTKALNFAYIYDKRFFAEINKKLSESYAAQKHWEKAYKYYKAYSQTNDSLSVESGKQSLANAEAKFQNKSKQQEIKSLVSENTIHELTIKNSKKQRIYLISGLVAIAIIGSLVYYQSRNRKKINQKLMVLNSELDKANKTKMQFFGILNHDLRSPVISLINFLHLQKEAPEMMDKETKERLELQTTTATEQLLEQMEDLLLWSKGQMENFVPSFRHYKIEEIFSDTKKEFVWVENIDVSFHFPENMIVFTDKEYMKTIIRNLINNSIKVLQDRSKAHIICKAWEENNESFIEISDNGGGANIEKFKALYDDHISIGIKKGLGLHVIRDLCKSIKCNIEVKSDLILGETYVLLRIKKT